MRRSSFDASVSELCGALPRAGGWWWRRWMRGLVGACWGGWCVTAWCNADAELIWRCWSVAGAGRVPARRGGVGGEALGPGGCGAGVSGIRAVAVVNMYGPTETTVRA